MGRLRLLPGERELVRLRPAWASWLGRNALALTFAAWGAAYVWLAPRVNGKWPGIGLDAALVAGPVAAAALLYLLRGYRVRFLLCVLPSLAALSLLLFVADASPQALAAPLVAASLVAVVLSEADRRAHAYHLTNLRIVHGGGLWSHEGWTVHYDSILDLDVRRSPLGRMFGYGSLDPVLSHPPEVAPPTRRRRNAVRAIEDTSHVRPSLHNVGRWMAVRRLLEAFVQDATANEYLRAEQQTQKRVQHAMRMLGRGNVLRR